MTAPALAHTRAELASLLADARAAGERVGFVPTMGALHEGHASLMRVATDATAGGPVVVSIFVNPMQFGPGEDLDRYPRTLDADLKICEREGVAIVFVPTLTEVYPGATAEGLGQQVTVEPGPLADVLEGKTRPGHYQGVLTVVAKLFGLVRPDVAIFGQKDYQQLVLITQMAADLNMSVEIVGAETERGEDGLALSSRNRYLSADEHLQALTLNRALRAAQDAAPYGPAAALDAARAEVRHSHMVDLDYLVITTPQLAELPDHPTPGTPARILIAARVGTTRLIDNLPLELSGALSSESE